MTFNQQINKQQQILERLRIVKSRLLNFNEVISGPSATATDGAKDQARNGVYGFLDISSANYLEMMDELHQIEMALSFLESITLYEEEGKQAPQRPVDLADSPLVKTTLGLKSLRDY